jgi:hypothetical protein
MATAKKVILPTPSPDVRPLPAFCTHMACAHALPTCETDLRDNVDTLLSHITTLFEAMTTAGGYSGGLAWLGVDLCKELEHRVSMLDCGHTYFK